MEPARDQRTSPPSPWSSQNRTHATAAGTARNGEWRFSVPPALAGGVVSVGVGASGVLRVCAAGRVAGCGCSVGACGTARKPLAALGLGLAAALRVRAVRAGGAGSGLVSHTIRPETRGKGDTMNRWTGTGHLTKDPKFLETENGTAICTLRLAVRRAGKQGHDGYFDVKCFDAQASACAQYLKGRARGRRRRAAAVRRVPDAGRRLRLARVHRRRARR